MSKPEDKDKPEKRDEPEAEQQVGNGGNGKPLPGD